MSRQNIMLDLYKSLSLDNLYKILLKIPTKIPMDGKATLEISQTKNDKTLYTIYGEHYSTEALRLMHEKIRPKAESNPHNWLFLVEGTPTSDIPEVIYGYLMGDKLKIPTENPIKDPYNKEVVEKAIESGMNPEEIYIALFVPMLQEVPNPKQVIAGLSEMWDISPNYLESLITYSFLELKENPEAISRKKEELKEIRSQMNIISNDLSSQKLEKILAKYNDKENIFAYLGSYHKSILDRI